MEGIYSYITVAILTGTLTWFFVLAIYRLYFHPLAKYPGPFLAKVTDWYNVYHAFSGDRHIEFHRIHCKYGRVVRYGPNRVSINSVTALKTIYNPKANCRKSSLFAVFPRFFNSWSTQTIIETEKFQHVSKRRAISQALHGKAIKHIEEAVVRNLQKLCSLLADASGNGWSSPFNVAELTKYLSFDIMGEVCFGESFKMLDTTENRYIVNVLSDGAQCLNTLGHMQWLLHTGLHVVLFHKLVAGLKSYKQYASLQCSRVIQSPPKRPGQEGVFQALLSAQNPKTGSPLFTQAELVSESSLLIIAGSDTTSTSLAASLFYLLHNPECLEQAREEVLGVFSNGKEIQTQPSDLSKCKYLRACIEESLRMSPPVGGLMPREILPGGMVIDGESFPEDVEVGTPHYAIHHNEEYYPKPFQYNPRRWLAEDCTPSSKDHLTTGDEITSPSQRASAAKAFCAFSLGPRDCVGKAFAYHELMSVLATLLWQFDMKLQEGSTLGEGGPALGVGRERVGDYQLYDAFASKNYGPMVQFRRREYGIA